MIEIKGRVKGQRVSSKELDEKIQSAVRAGKTSIRLTADGQHGIGGRIWPGERPVKLRFHLTNARLYSYRATSAV